MAANQGQFGWVELLTPDAATAQQFYADLFGWTFDGTDEGYHEIKLGDRAKGGIRTVGAGGYRARSFLRGPGRAGGFDDGDAN